MKYSDSIERVASSLCNKPGGSILVTGATGLIGRCIIDVLIQINRQIPNKYKIYALGRSRERLMSIFEDKVIPIVQNIVEPLDDSLEFNYIVHAASNADPIMYAIQPVETILTNIIGSKNVLDYCRRHNKTRMLLTSTFEVYGKIADVDVYEEEMVGIVDFQIIRNGYTESKRCAELLERSYIDEYGVDAVIARLSSIYGPTMSKNDSKAHAQFIKNAINGENIVLKSDGLQRRTYCYVIDAASGILEILFNGKTGEAYNVANENSIATIAEVARTCASIAGTKVVFDFPDQIESKGFSKSQNCILDNRKLRKLGWNGMYSLEDGMRETIENLK